MNQTARAITVGVSILVPMITYADALGDAQRFVCSSQQVTLCDGRDCESGLPQQWNVPSFVAVDLTKKTLTTLASSTEQRRTPVMSVARDQGKLYLQGSENGRAFSLVVDLTTGLATMAIAEDGFTVSIFGDCAPMP